MKSSIRKMSIKILPKLQPWVLFVSVVVVCWYIGKLFWLFVNPVTPQVAPPQKLSSSAQTASISAQSLAVFEVNKQTQSRRPNRPTNASLSGTMPAKPQQNSSAIFAENGNIKSFKVGEYIFESSYKLTQVDFKQVTLTNDYGNKKTLRLKADTNLGSGFSSLGNGFTKAPDATAQILPTQSSKQTQYTPKRSNKSEKTRRNVERFIDFATAELEKNPKEFLNRSGLKQTDTGYVVTSAMNRGIRRSSGLQPGDTIISVNGTPLGNLQEDMGLLEEIKKKGSVQVQVQRGESVVTINQSF